MMTLVSARVVVVPVVVGGIGDDVVDGTLGGRGVVVRGWERVEKD
jgi:hypothetical protein